MTTLSDLRSRLRTLLNDSAAEGYLWSDAALNLHLGDAIRSYSRSFPAEKETVFTTAAGQGEYVLPADCSRVVRVGVGAYSSAPIQEGSDPFGEGYEVYSGKLVLLPAPSESGWAIAVRYLAPHTIPVLDEDISTVPESDEDLLLASGAARAIESLVVDEAKRDRFETRYGQSASAAAEFHRRQYEAGSRTGGEW